MLVTGLAACSQTPIERFSAEEVSPQSGSLYRTQPGDTLWEISHGFGMSIAELAAHNGIEDASLLKVGQQLHIPIPVESNNFLWPLLGTFSRTDNLDGLILSAPAGSWVRASRGGEAVFVSEAFSSFGPTVILDHGDGFHTVYAGMSELMVHSGDMLPQGSALGKTAKGTLYFEIRQEAKVQDTLFLLPRL